MLAYRLGNRQIAGRHHDNHTVPRSFNQAHFSEGTDLVDPGIGPGIRQKHKTGIQPESNAISHKRSGNKAVEQSIREPENPGEF
jgi:hypothetical protein